MSDFSVEVDVGLDHVARVTFERGERNYFTLDLMAAIADELEALAEAKSARSVVLHGNGTHFCAGADLARGATAADLGSISGTDGPHIYDHAVRIFRQPLPLVAAIRGAAVGGGLGLALVCDLRVASSDARFSAPFARLGVHHGFGLSVTLPLTVGYQHAIDLLYTGRRITADQARSIGLVDRVTDSADALGAAHELAAEIAASAPIAIRSIRQTLRSGVGDAFEAAVKRERAEQALHFDTADMDEGVRADQQRRPPKFTGR